MLPQSMRDVFSWQRVYVLTRTLAMVLSSAPSLCARARKIAIRNRYLSNIEPTIPPNTAAVPTSRFSLAPEGR